jgi:hypothetical protein
MQGRFLVAALLGMTRERRWAPRNDREKVVILSEAKDLPRSLAHGRFLVAALLGMTRETLL